MLVFRQMNKYLALSIAFLIGLIIVGIAHTKNEERREEAKFNGCNGLEVDWTDSYQGGAYGKCLHEAGYECDYGYSEKYTGCCDEDNYACEVCNGNNFDCSEFSDQEEAQGVYDLCTDFNIGDVDIHNLDEDSDGVACESLIPVLD